MCRETLIYGAEYFLLLAPTITKLIFLKILLKGGIPKLYTFTYLTILTFKLELTEVQDAAKKKPNFEL